MYKRGPSRDITDHLKITCLRIAQNLRYATDSHATVMEHSVIMNDGSQGGPALESKTWRTGLYLFADRSSGRSFGFKKKETLPATAASDSVDNISNCEPSLIQHREPEISFHG